MRLATYNIQGADLSRLEQISEIIRIIAPDVMALQEVGSLTNASYGRDAFARLKELTGMELLAGPTGLGYYGNAILTRYGISGSGREELNFPSREPRGLLYCCMGGEACRAHNPGQASEASHAGKVEKSMEKHSQINDPPCFMVYCTHLGLRQRERWHQILRMSARIRRLGTLPFFLMGDLNIWNPFSSQLSYLEKRLNLKWETRATFPARFPVLSLDRIGYAGNVQFVNSGRLNNSLTRRVSDHLPFFLDVELNPLLNK